MGWVPPADGRPHSPGLRQAARSLQVPDAKVPPLTYLPRTRGLTSISQARGRGVCLAKHLVGRSSSPGGRVPIERAWLHSPLLPLSEVVVPCVLRPGRAASLQITFD